MRLILLRSTCGDTRTCPNINATVAPDEVLPRYLAAKEAAWSGAVDFADYWKAHPGYWRDPSAA